MLSRAPVDAEPHVNQDTVHITVAMHKLCLTFRFHLWRAPSSQSAFIHLHSTLKGKYIYDVTGRQLKRLLASNNSNNYSKS
ncbi:hypothetical protein OUZ56_020678 [Daphnia magna]|uniref:Uncharacterized protein n=1 Tax=Daphnia magna TaxID=35525 RepID=A0ABQ9ZG79_9CRUS|nr:hypothetical protein OUZ56_020678 [Daphnia magna]